MKRQDVMLCLKALGDETRVRILLLLMQGELCVCQIKEVLGVSQPLASRHLSVLKHAGLLEARREGKLMYYKLSKDAGSGGKLGLIRVLKNALKSDSVVVNDRQRLRDCHAPHDSSHREGRQGRGG